MVGIFWCNPTNSTFFTTCCEVAICDNERKCPRCRKYVYPYFEDMTEDEMEEVGGGYYNHRAHMARRSVVEKRY